jgi:carnitine 3-dehydrogenase
MECARLTVLPGWIDYNGHMTESRYLFASSETVDAFLRHIGADIAYVGTGYSYYTAETHILHLGEAKLGDALTGTVQILHADEKRLHVFVRIVKGDEVVATLEQMLLHVDMKAGKTCPAPQSILDRLLPIAKAHAALEKPASAGRHVGQRK